MAYGGTMLTINIDSNSKEPMYEQIYKYIREEIKSGRIANKVKLPSCRSLAQYLSISRNTVDLAYAQLQSEGYIEAIPKKGYFVCEISELINIDTPLYSIASEGEKKQDTVNWDFSPSGVDMESFPYSKWRKFLKDSLSYNNSEIFQSGDKQGEYQFRLAIANYLFHSRNVNCEPNQIIVGAGSEYLLLLLSQILGSDKIIAMENPSYMQAYNVLKGLNHEIIPIDLDKNGMRVDLLNQTNAQIAYVTPSHQYPLGIVMPIARRMQLLSWANCGDDRYIIEDDYDSEFRYLGRPIPALQGSDNNNKVIYIGTFSKAIAPAIRVSYMVLPASLFSIYKKRLSHYSSTVSRIDQFVLEEFITGGYFERHLNKMRGIYKSKHDKIIKELKKGKIDARILGESSGLHIILEFEGHVCEEELINKAIAKGVKVYPVSRYYLSPLYAKTQIMLGYARLSEGQIEEGVCALINAWK